MGIKPLGKMVSIVETDTDIPLTDLMVKRISFAWELMFTRPLYEVDLEFQGFVLNAGAEMLDSGVLRMPEVNVLPFDLDSLKLAHAEQESGKAICKTVLTRDQGAVKSRAIGGA